MKSLAAIVSLLAALTLAAGCMKVGPDYAQPPAPATREGFQNAPAQAQYKDQDRWWEEFGDPDLNKLVQLAVQRNTDIQVAAARVLERQAAFVQAHGARYPSLSLNGQAGKSQSAITNPTLANVLASSRRTENYQLTAAASFEVDLWGRLARAEEAARADLLASEENRRTVVQTVIAGVVSSYLSVEALERRLGVAEKSVKAYGNSLALVESRYERGLVSLLDWQSARRAYVNAQAQVPSLRMELAREQQKLMVLAGYYPATRPARAQPGEYFQEMPPVPPGLPSQLLTRRPDLMAAEASLAAASARIGVARAARFPSITLTGAFGYSSTALNRLIEPASELWSLAGGLTAPIFNAGQLEAVEKQARAAYQREVATWAGSVLAAFQEVEGSLVTREELLKRRELVAAALAEARATQETALNRYQRGLSDYLRVLEAMNTRYTLEDTLLLVELGILTNRVTLHRALGGGWDNIAPSPKEA